jgi:hypothetical protein
MASVSRPPPDGFPPTARQHASTTDPPSDAAPRGLACPPALPSRPRLKLAFARPPDPDHVRRVAWHGSRRATGRARQVGARPARAPQGEPYTGGCLAPAQRAPAFASQRASPSSCFRRSPRTRSTSSRRAFLVSRGCCSSPALRQSPSRGATSPRDKSRCFRFTGRGHEFARVDGGPLERPDMWSISVAGSATPPLPLTPVTPSPLRRFRG